MSRRLAQLPADPGALIGLLVAAQVVAWTLAPALTHSAPPLDVVEGYMWGREWVLATYKHPALPSWALEASRLVAGGIVGWPAYLLSQLFVGAAFLCVYVTGCDLVGRERAAAGTLLLTGVAFYAWPTPEFNHNVAEMPFWAALPLALWRAVEGRGVLWWALAGAVAAGGLYAKLTTALLLLVLAAWMLWDARARASLATPGPWVGLAVFALLAAPLATWLLANDFLPLRYAAARTGQPAGRGVPAFIVSVLLNLAGMAAMLAIAGLVGRSMTAPPGTEAEPPERRALAFLVFVVAGPLALTLAAAIALGSNLKSAWGSSMFNYLGVLAVALVSARFTPAALRRLAVCAAVLIVAVPAGYAAAIAAGPTREGRPVRVSWPQAEISRRFLDVWAQATGGRPLRIVAGDPWIAGLIGVSAPAVPSILTHGNLALSPWISPVRIAREGMLVVWDARLGGTPPHLAPLVGSRTVREERFRVGRGGGQDAVVVGYAVVLPAPAP